MFFIINLLFIIDNYVGFVYTITDLKFVRRSEESESGHFVFPH